jgi:AhpD family alkylhydroperoxidase
MSARIKNLALVLAEAVKPLQSLHAVANSADVPAATMALVHLRASQINGCSFCVDMAAKHAKKEGESDERLFAVAAWREAPYFTDAERAALALSESVTRLSDSSDPVPDSIWNEAARHFEQKALAALLLWISTSNLYNRLNVAIRHPAGASWS